MHLERKLVKTGVFDRFSPSPGIAGVLDTCVIEGQFLRADAERLGVKILHDNAAQFFNLGDPIGAGISVG